MILTVTKEDLALSLRSIGCSVRCGFSQLVVRLNEDTGALGQGPEVVVRTWVEREDRVP